MQFFCGLVFMLLPKREAIFCGSCAKIIAVGVVWDGSLSPLPGRCVVCSVCVVLACVFVCVCFLFLLPFIHVMDWMDGFQLEQLRAVIFCRIVSRMSAVYCSVLKDLT